MSNPILEVVVNKPMKIKQIIAELNVKQPIAVLIEGKQVAMDQEVQEGQKIVILPMIAGGSDFPEPRFPFFPEEIALQQQYSLILTKNTKRERWWRFKQQFEIAMESPIKPLVRRELFQWYEELILRDSRIQPPQVPSAGSNIVVESVEFCVRNLKRFKIITRDPMSYQWTKVLSRAELNRAIEDTVDRFQYRMNQRETELAERMERYTQEIEEYNFQMQLIKATVEDYIAQVPSFEGIAQYKLIKEEIERDRYAIPSRYKPRYDPKTKEFTIYEGHESGEFHISTNLQLYETGFIVFTVDTYGRKILYSASRTQMYYFSLEAERFFTAKARNVQETGAEPLRYFGSFDQKQSAPEIYQKCYICDRKLHQPAFPIKIGENWVYQLRMCCGCFKRFEQGEISVERAMEEASVKMGEWELQQELQTREEIPSDNVARIRPKEEGD